MFGTSARVDLTSTSLPQETISRLRTEQDLIAVLQNPDDESEESDDSDESQHLTDLDQRQEDIQNHRSAARSSQSSHAERMVKRSRIELTAYQIRDNVAVPIPLVDRGRGDPRNILGVIVSRSKSDQCKISTRCGLLKCSYSRNQFDICPERLRRCPYTGKLVSLREAVRMHHYWK